MAAEGDFSSYLEQLQAGSPAIQAKACGALANLAGNAEMGERLIASGCTNILFGLLASPDPGVQAQATIPVGSRVAHDARTQAGRALASVASCGAAFKVQEVMILTPLVALLHAPDTGRKGLCTTAALIIGNLAVEDGNGALLHEAGACNALLDVLRSGSEEVKYLLFACGNLAAQMSLRGVEVLFVDCLHI